MAPEMMTEFNSESANFKIPRGYGMPIVNLYFWLGLVSAILLRIIIIADYYNPIWAKVLWYVGVAGYLWFFMHRHHIAQRRFSVIKDFNLLEKVRNRQEFSEKDFEGLDYLLWSLSVSKERANYMIIAVFSVLALIVSLSLDFEILKII